VVARAIVASPIPVVSGVGHESDFTIADFVADLRAPTPTAAAELVSPSRAELAARVAELRQRLARSVRRRIEQRMQQLDYLGRRLLSPVDLVRQRASQVEHLAKRLSGAMARTQAAAVHRLALAAQRHAALRPDLRFAARRLDLLGHRLGSAGRRSLERRSDTVGRLGAQLAHLNPTSVLARGYSITRREDGSVVRDATLLAIDQRLSLTFATGGAEVRVEQKRDS
jgi:exodeoxyribonuclease VII large subunit